jgi:Family of unknown function (DUF6112)
VRRRAITSRPAGNGLRRIAAIATLTGLVNAASAVAAPVIQPNSSIPGTAMAEKLLGGLWTLGFVACAGGLVIGLAVMGLAGHSGNPQWRSRGRTGVLVSLCAAVLLGAANALLSWATGVGQGF